MSAYYSKELPDQPFYVQGKAYRFDIIKVDDPGLIVHFDNAAVKGIGGIQRIDEAQYLEALKKKTQSPTSSPVKYQREEFKQKLPNYSRSREKPGKRKSVAAEGKVATVPEKSEDKQDNSAYIPKTVKGIYR